MEETDLDIDFAVFKSQYLKYKKHLIENLYLFSVTNINSPKPFIALFKQSSWFPRRKQGNQPVFC